MISHWTSVHVFARPYVCRTLVGPSVFSFPDDTGVYIYQWMFTKLDICIDIVEIWFGICPPHESDRVLSFHVFIKPCVIQAE